MSVIRRQRSTWTTVDNRIINDEKLTLEALGLLVYMLSKPDAWEFSQEQLGRQWGRGREAMRSIMKTLQVAGYVRRTIERDAAGRIRTITIVSELPEPPSTEVPAPDTGEPPPVDPPDGDPPGGDAVALVKTDPSNDGPAKTEGGAAAQPPSKAGAGVTLKEYVAALEAKGERFVADSAALVKHMQTHDIPADFMRLAWRVFERHYSEGKAAKKRYADWRMVMLNGLRERWQFLTLWYEGDNGLQLNQRGLQAQREFASTADHAITSN